MNDEPDLFRLFDFGLISRRDPESGDGTLVCRMAPEGLD
jgi:hypothetical protein